MWFHPYSSHYTQNPYQFCSRLLAVVVAAQHQDLDHADEDVEEVKLKADGLVDGVGLVEAALSETGLVLDLLDVIEGEATEDGKTTVEPNVLGPGKGADGVGREDQRSETGNGNNASTGKEGTANVEVLVLLGGGTDKGEAAHHSNGVETGASDKSGAGHGEERSDHGSLGGVEDGPGGILGDVAVTATMVRKCGRHRIRREQHTCRHRWSG